MRATFHLKIRPLIVGSALCCAFLGHAQAETRDSVRTNAWNRRWDADRVGLAFSLNGKVYESELARASIIAAPGWIPSEPSPFPAHKAVEAAAPVARSVAGSLGSWRVSQIRLYSLGPPTTQAWYYAVFFQPSGPSRSSNAVIVAVDFAGRVGTIMSRRTREPWAPWALEVFTNGPVIFGSRFGGNEYRSELESRWIRTAPEWVPPQPSPFPAEKAVRAAFPVAHSFVGDVDGWYVGSIRLYSLPEQPESWYYGVSFRPVTPTAITKFVAIGVDFAGRVGRMSTNVVSDLQVAF